MPGVPKSNLLYDLPFEEDAPSKFGMHRQFHSCLALDTSDIPCADILYYSQWLLLGEYESNSIQGRVRHSSSIQCHIWSHRVSMERLHLLEDVQ